MSKPGPQALLNVKRVMTYLKGTVTLDLTYSEDAELGDELIAYLDAEHAGDLEVGYSTTGAVMYLGGAPIDWTYNNQTVVAIGTVKAEYVARSKAWLITVHRRHLM